MNTLTQPKFQIISTYKGRKENATLQINIPHWGNTEFTTIGEAETCLRKNATPGLKYLIVPIWECEDIEFPKINCSIQKVLKKKK